MLHHLSSSLTGTLDTALAALTRSGSQAMSMWVPPPAAAALATLDTRSVSNLFRPEITCLHSTAHLHCLRFTRWAKLGQTQEPLS